MPLPAKTYTITAFYPGDPKPLTIYCFESTLQQQLNQLEALGFDGEVLEEDYHASYLPKK